jgi:hypothetical protein
MASTSVPSRSIPSPLTTQIPHLSAAEIAALPYPPDYYPGARDVKTPYGSMRVYEWGPESGRKIMLVHGDATCAPVWKRVAEGLVEKGARVCVVGRCWRAFYMFLSFLFLFFFLLVGLRSKVSAPISSSIRLDERTQTTTQTSDCDFATLVAALLLAPTYMT